MSFSKRPQCRALLIVDVQNGFVNEKTAHIPSMVEKLQYDYDVVFATRFINLPNSPYRRLIKWNRFSPGTDDIELAFHLREDAVVIDKYVYTCVDDSFLRLLDEKGITSVDICGIDTDICVTKCAVDLFEKGFIPFVLKNICATTASEDLQEAALIILARYIGKSQIMSTAHD